jgi:predicted nucleic acid-binding protein
VTIVIADACSLINFAEIRRMDLLRQCLPAQSRWTEAVAHEVGQSAQYLPDLRVLINEGWLGEPIQLNARGDVEAVQRIRTALGGVPENPLKHLGEAESIQVVVSRPELRQAVLLTDDREARHVARGRGVMTWDATRLLASPGDVSWPVGLAVLQQMRQCGRGVRIPASEAEFR